MANTTHGTVDAMLIKALASRVLSAQLSFLVLFLIKKSYKD